MARVSGDGAQPDSPPDRRSGQAMLPMASRVICVVVAIALLGGGSWAVFDTDNEAGTALLLAVGALFSLVGLSGHLPSRMKFGDNELEFIKPVMDAVADGIKNGPPEVAEALTSAALSALNDSSATVASQQRATILGEVAALAHLRQICLEKGWRLDAEPAGGRVDAIVETGTGRYGFEIKLHRRPVNTPVVKSAFERMALSGLKNLVLVTMYPVSPVIQGTLRPEFGQLDPPRDLWFMSIGTDPQAWLDNLRTGLDSLN